MREKLLSKLPKPFRTTKLKKIKAYRPSHFSRARFALFGAVFAGLGAYVVFGSFAATPSPSIEPENGTIVTPATIINDATASGGKAIKFGTISQGPCPVSTPNVPDGPDAFGGCFPGPETTGVPSGTTLSTYTGPCTITTNNTMIDSKTINCDLQIQASGVQITKSKINGQVWIPVDDWPNPYSFTITDSEIDTGNLGPSNNEGKSSIGKSNFVATRVETKGGIRGVWCEYNCTVKDSWIHGQATGKLNCTNPGCAVHESAARQGSGPQGQGQNFIHNVLHCEPPTIETNDPLAPSDSAGCSADLTGYGDFAPIQNNTVDKNLFMATEGGTCAYGGSSGEGIKPYASQANNNKYTNNIFKRGPAGHSQSSPSRCGYYFAIADFNSSRPGNVWTNNKFDDGTVLPADN